MRTKNGTLRIRLRFNQLGRRNLSDDQRAILADAAIEAQSRIEQKERAKVARRSVKARNPMKSSDLLVDASNKRSQPKEGTRIAVSKRAKISERKLKRARSQLVGRRGRQAGLRILD